MQVEASLEGKRIYLLDQIKNSMVQTLGISFTVLRYDLVSATMPVDTKTKQPFGILHGGASVALAESLASIGAWLNIDEKLYRAVGIEINANHLRAVSEGSVRGDATPLHRGALTHVWEVRIVTPDDKLVCVSRCTLAILDSK